MNSRCNAKRRPRKTKRAQVSQLSQARSEIRNVGQTYIQNRIQNNAEVGMSSVDHPRAHLIEKLHPQILGNVSYVHLCEAMGVGKEFIDAAIPASLAFSEEMRASDPLEALAITQALIAHARSAWLARLATRQTDPHSLCMINEASGRASITFARLMAAIQQHRRPAAPPATTVSIGQANLANQQVINTVRTQQLSEGARDDEQTRMRDEAAIPTLAARPEIPPHLDQAQAPVGNEHRAKKPARKGARGAKRLEARLPLRRGGRAAKVGRADDQDT